jgi:hypothetical protein
MTERGESYLWTHEAPSNHPITCFRMILWFLLSGFAAFSQIPIRIRPTVRSARPECGTLCCRQRRLAALAPCSAELFLFSCTEELRPAVSPSTSIPSESACAKPATENTSHFRTIARIKPRSDDRSALPSTPCAHEKWQGSAGNFQLVLGER